MTRTVTRKAEKKIVGRQAADKMPSPEQLQDGSVDEQISTSVIKQSKVKGKVSRKSRKKEKSDAQIVKQEVNVSEDDEISFNFHSGNHTEAEASKKIETAQLKGVSSVEKQATLPENQEPMLSPTADTVIENQGAHSRSQDKASMEPVSNQEPDGLSMDTNQVQEETVLTQQSQATSPKGKKQSGVKQPLRKRKASDQEPVVPMKKSSKREETFFYCGNLPVGVTQETLKYFLEEEGIHSRIFLKRRKAAKNKLIAKMTRKEKKYKKNQLRVATTLFATVIVKTKEDAKKMMSLNGITMPSPSRNDWGTELKIVKRLPRPKQFPYKVHVGGLHPRINEDELQEYLEGRGITPGHVVVIRTHSTQKSRRYGFVWFKSVPDADKAVDLPEPVMRDRPLVIQHSFKKKFKNF